LFIRRVWKSPDASGAITAKSNPLFQTMGGKGSGGKRFGAGRPRKSREERQLGGNAGHRPLALVPPSKSNTEQPAAAAPETASPPPVRFPPPKILNAQESFYWTLWAPLAEKAGHLTEERVPGMVLLCQIAAARDRDPSIGPDWRDLTRQLGQHLARFGLTSDGRLPEVPVAQTKDDEGSALARLLSIR
jgi:hypothetical protein